MVEGCVEVLDLFVWTPLEFGGALLEQTLFSLSGIDGMDPSIVLYPLNGLAA